MKSAAKDSGEPHASSLETPLCSQKIAPASAPPTLWHGFSEADGRQLALDMMREIHERWCAEDPPDEFRHGGDEDAACKRITEHFINMEPEILRRYIAVVSKQHSKALERGFLCILSDYIASAIGGVGPDLDSYE